jgi:SAM-dependent methyltransferase
MTDPAPWTPGNAGTDVRKHAPATIRNRDAILIELRDLLPASGTVLEVASGSGEHVAYFAPLFPALTWQPSDPDAAALASIAAWTHGLANVRPPVMLDAAAADWPVDRADAIFCANMVHIAPWAAALGLMAGAGRVLAGGAPLILYGPFVEDGVETASSNLAFDRSLKERDPRWGLRPVGAMAKAGAAHGLALTDRIEMPANNLMLVFRRR